MDKTRQDKTEMQDSNMSSQAHTKRTRKGEGNKQTNDIGTFIEAI